MVRRTPHPAARAGAKEDEAALHVSVVYQDSLTREWTRELWGRVGQLIGHGGICRKFWRIDELAEPRAFGEAVCAAAKADMLLIALRDTPEVPPLLRKWVEAWLPHRGERPGALVALIGMPSHPGAPRGYAHQFLEMVAAKGGLDYLPRERKLPEQTLASSKRTKLPTKVWLALAI